MTGLVTAAALSDTPTSAAEYVFAFAVVGGLLASGITVSVVRFVRSRRPRQEQMARLAAQLNGRWQVCVRMEETGLDRADLLRVAYSRGYGMIEHRFGKYYEFVYAPHRVPSGRPR
jgi:hypothetical protein